ncbi:MAG: NUDIX domain-containing protein [Actinomycetota bacterium]
MSDEHAAIAAATVIPLRDGPDGLEALLLRRADELRSFGGMWVFPGGRIDPVDADGAADEEAAARRAAVREAGEEAGLGLDPADLVHLSHWSPPPRAGRRFATWFFLALADGHDVRIDDGEVRAHRWTTPVAALEARDAGDFELAPPTVVTLHQLAGFGRAVDALAHPHRPEVFESQIARHDGPRTLLWHGDVGYGGGDPAAEGPRHRLVMTERWTYERTI